jgi:ubiquinone/menaquinone biosynthesis C-methylase UbiE
VVGVDYDEAMIAEADQRAQEAGVTDWVAHRHADATALPFDPDTFDAARSERLFQHLPDPEPALSEMVRVTRSGGWVIVLDTDFGTLSIDTSEVEIEQRLKSYRLEHHVHNAFSGRQLYRLFKQQGLVDLTLEICPIYVTDYAVARQSGNLDEVEEGALAAERVTRGELRRWHTSLEEADARGVFFGSVTQTMVAGCKP